VRHVFVNDLPYNDGQENPLGALGDALAFAADDWADTRAKAWVWGIVLGWDDEAMAELAADFHWDDATVARLRRLHEGFDALSGQQDG